MIRSNSHGEMVCIDRKDCCKTIFNGTKINHHAVKCKPKVPIAAIYTLLSLDLVIFSYTGNTSISVDI